MLYCTVIKLKNTNYLRFLSNICVFNPLTLNNDIIIKVVVFVEVCIPVFSDLQVGQIAFRNTKSLNQIQSVVFDTGYTTNESLLICAPTVAGKTIIAMLTILHTVCQHIENGVIHSQGSLAYWQVL